MAIFNGYVNLPEGRRSHMGDGPMGQNQPGPSVHQNPWDFIQDVQKKWMLKDL